jgi:SAM-dependent methyltransferase
MTDNQSYYETRFAFNSGRSVVWKAIAEYLNKFIPQESAVLDLGCGYGDFVNNISAKSKYAIDLNPDNKQHMNADVNFFGGSVLEPFPIADNSVDVVFASNLLEHFDDAELAIILNSVKRCLKPGGRFIIMQPNYFYCYREYWDDYTHKKAFSHTAIVDFFQSSGLKVIKAIPRFMPFSLKSRLPKSYWLTKMYLNSPIRPFAKQMLVVAKKES